MKKEKLVALALAIIIIVVAATVVAYEVISAKPSTLQILNQISNSGSQDTTEFTIDHTWAIAWKINKQNDNLFTLAVYIKSGTSYSPVTETSETDTNTTHGILPVPYTGTFVIRVITSEATEWTLIIEEIS
jgi:predicted PurR-regulated permease PerM